jgi:hypothetical protein
MRERGAFVISLDLELLWGTHDLPPAPGVLRHAAGTRAVVSELLDLFARYEVPATWATVGHLFLEGAERDQAGRAHPGHPRPRHSWLSQDWFAALPDGDARRRPEWYAPDLITRIQSAQPRQEVASHSFSHVIFGDPGCDAQVARAELTRAVDAARSFGIDLKSFVFPRNEVGHLALLPELGFEVFRGPETAFYWGLPSKLRKVLHMADRLVATTPAAVLPYRTPEGPINLPGSMLYLAAFGWRRLIPIRRRVVQAWKGIAGAIERKAVFHLWMHPEGLVDHQRSMLRGLETILQEVLRLRRARRLDVMTMYDAAHAYL